MEKWTENFMQRFTDQEAPAGEPKAETTETAKEEFIRVMGSIKRHGAADLLAWLETEGFFTSPASCKNHLAVEGGLLIHSLNVYHNLRTIAGRKTTQGAALLNTQEDEESVAIMGLLHDVCKVGVYHVETKRRKNPKTGMWEDYQAYVYRDPLPLGHGEKSLYQINRFMSLQEHEALAIRWHMGAFDTAARADLRDLSAAMEASPWVYLLHEADMQATHVNERGV